MLAKIPTADQHRWRVTTSLLDFWRYPDSARYKRFCISEISYATRRTGIADVLTLKPRDDEKNYWAHAR